jgi:hypothetical protein
MKAGSFGLHGALVAAALAFLPASSGCVPATPGVLDPSGFNQPEYGYRVDYTKPGGQSFLGADWRVDNFAPDEMKGGWKAKDGPNYVAIRELDEDDDGKIAEKEKHEEPIYDLRLTNAHDDGVIWVKAHPLAYQDSGRDLEVELNGYADSLSGRGAYYQGSVFQVVHEKSREFTTFVVDQEKRAIGGFDGIIATVEVAETARLQLEPTYRNAKIRVFLAKMRYLHKVAMSDVDGKPLTPTRWPLAPCTKNGIAATCEQRVGMLVAGYVNAAARFEQHIPEFEKFLSEISLGARAAAPAASVASP